MVSQRAKKLMFSVPELLKVVKDNHIYRDAKFCLSMTCQVFIAMISIKLGDHPSISATML
jgi:hypothetical protein